VVRADQDSSVVVVEPTGAQLSTELESQLFRETFEARFLLGSTATERIGSFLQSCVFCPSEAATVREADRAAAGRDHPRPREFDLGGYPRAMP
jgi:hypothetical protein